MYFSRSDAVEIVNTVDYFRPITAGLDEAGNQKYALWAISQGVTHWMPLPGPPKPREWQTLTDMADLDRM